MIPADHFHDNGDGTALVVEQPNGLPALTEMCGDDERPLDRPCDTCDGWSKVYENDVGPCPDCDGSGRHTFTVEVAAPPPIDGYVAEPSLRVHVIDVTEREDGQWVVKLKVHE